MQIIIKIFLKFGFLSQHYVKNKLSLINFNLYFKSVIASVYTGPEKRTELTLDRHCER